ncbi:MAG: nucleotidyltransferase domain-containing protein, partial [Paraclostridium sp.]
MRNIPEKTKNSIIDVFPKEDTLAIIIFGSYATQRQTRNSDLDIA